MSRRKTSNRVGKEVSALYSEFQNMHLKVKKIVNTVTAQIYEVAYAFSCAAAELHALYLSASLDESST